MALNSLLLTVPDPSLDPSLIEVALNKASDWLRYSPGCWLILTRRDATFWYRVILGIEEIDERHVFLSEVNLANKSGQLSPEAWQWIKKAQAKIAAEAMKDEGEWMAAAQELEPVQAHR